MKKGIRREENTIVFCGIIIIGMILLFHVTVFNHYKNNLIDLQEDHMITTAKAVANNLRTFYEENKKTFGLFFATERSEQEIDHFFEVQPEISSVMIIDRQNQIKLQRGTDYREWLPQLLESYNQNSTNDPLAYLSSPILTGDRHFTQFMIRESGQGAEQTYVVASIELPYVYEMIVKSITIGQYGYSMVKNMDGIILMHKAVNQIGIDAVEGRKKQYQELQLDLSDLEDWIEEQRSLPAGSRILNSYWWDDENIPLRSKKIVAYTQIPIGAETWILNCTLDYNEIDGPLKQAQQYVFLSSVIVLVGFGFLCFWLIDNKNKNQRMKMEMVHLKEMNEAWEELHKREEQLRHRDKIQTLGTMTSMISHEFNNFLTPIMLYGELLMTDERVSADQKEYLEEMMESAQRASELTKELSLYGRSEQHVYKKVMVTITDEIKRSVKMLKKALPANITMELSLEPDDGYGLLAGQGMVNQIITNLATNAVHAMKETGGALTIKGRIIKDEVQAHYGITVIDTGCGISEQRLKQIFTPFYTTKEAGKGTGLGLSVVNDLIHQLSGDIHVISEEGRGTRFDLLLPISKVPDKEKQAKVPNASLADKTVLILDDSEKVTRALAKSLRPRCQKVAVFQQPEKALAAIKQQLSYWDVIITDYEMPFMNGLELAGILRSMGYQNKIILISGQLKEDISWYLEKGVIDDFLPKPTSAEEMIKIINS